MDFTQWRATARRLLAGGIPPHQAQWDEPGQGALFAPATPGDAPTDAVGRVPARLLPVLEDAACHRSPRRLALMYRVLWRTTHGERTLPADPADDDMRALHAMQRDVRRDRHKMTAFVRFRELRDAAGGDPRWIAWYEPSHRILATIAPFFVERFGSMHWTIATPDGIATWDRHALTVLPPAARPAPPEDAGEGLWLSYYRSIFNPARLNVRAMRQHMPQKYWANLPEARAIPALVADATRRAGRMVEDAPRPRPPVAARPVAPAPAAADGVPTAAVLDACRACPLWQPATQAVAGTGATGARLMVVGEQPGDEEDLRGVPFVGPAGKLFDRALAEAGVRRDDVWLTNAVKHFSFEPRGKRRLHKTPAQREIEACRQWLEREIAAVTPAVIVALGATALSALLGHRLKVGEARTRDDLRHAGGARVIATYHPAAVLRAPDDSAAAAMHAALVADLARAARAAHDPVP